MNILNDEYIVNILVTEVLYHSNIDSLRRKFSKLSLNQLSTILHNHSHKINILPDHIHTLVSKIYIKEYKKRTKDRWKQRAERRGI